ncbi:RdgB/HAM1 family non-canonical purine NTP pyrophosphatase [Spongiibacter sp. KMU-158]|uniref:dITP/XTP pyrophosphatase n=1 Tax=Spongiibacter pelagi TaxID=2760804 RepID=A0A927BXJ4_9GAMM|nr:RdgB/HAM1 family non-canonical purine NTP pyrophosphatase [Spongiibacter pelagi]MBD2857398.1 RdgB/HAM1 family non-canonical purine NTP pyrophosphatase [Spongiibacter pelagi]
MSQSLTTQQPQTLVLASGNKGKLAELNSLLAEQGFTVRSQSEFDVIEAEENGLSFVENALIKARNAARQTGLPALADDSGLCVDALNGAPGIYSARFAGANASDADNNALLLEKLAAESKRHAHFHCALVMVNHADDPAPIICEGLWHGEILHAPEGENGFGYDPLFYVPSLNCSSAALNKAQKNAISHRGLALQQFIQRLSK